MAPPASSVAIGAAGGTSRADDRPSVWHDPTMKKVLLRADLRRALRGDRSDTILDVWVVPGAGRSEIVGVHNDALRVRIAAPPEHGEANRAMLKMLGRVLGAEVALESGVKARRKRVRVAGLSPSRVTELLADDPDGSA